MDNQEKQPETFADLSPDRQRAWSSLQETQLFLQQLKVERENVHARLLASCEPIAGDTGREHSIAARAELYRLDYCINTIEAGQQQ